jgi:hypothetical protein
MTEIKLEFGGSKQPLLVKIFPIHCPLFATMLGSRNSEVPSPFLPQFLSPLTDRALQAAHGESVGHGDASDQVSLPAHNTRKRTGTRSACRDRVSCDRVTGVDRSQLESSEKLVNSLDLQLQPTLNSVWPPM